MERRQEDARMTRLSQSAIAAASLALLAVAGTLSGERPAAADNNKPDKDKVTAVQIVAPVPLPVNARITSPVPLPVEANIVSSVPLVVSALPTAPAEPYQQAVFVTIDAGTTGNLASVDVPSGKRLVIEQVAGTAFLPAGQAVRVTRIRTDFSGAGFTLVGNPVAGQTDSVTTFNHAMKLYASQNVEFSVSRAPSSTGSGFCAFAVSGYLVDQ
jgi:hypothetical protein